MNSLPVLQHLPEDTRNKLRSTQILTSLTQIISELLQNSLDAGARHIDIGVDCEEWTCWIRDDGKGMSRDDMELLAQGSEQGRYGTSKMYEPETIEAVSTFGFRGEALASVADLCCLEISSRTTHSRETWSLILKGGKKLYKGPAIRWKRERAGTVVCVRDAFFSLPIRRLSHPSPSRTMDAIRQEMDSFSLVFPHITFSLENLTAGRRNATGNHIFRIPKTESTVMSFRHLYGRALVEHIEEIHEVSGSLKLDGFISLDGAHSKNYQFIYVNKHPVALSMDLHRVIDTKFAQSTFMKNALGETGETTLPRSNTRRSPRKTERRPVYVLNLTVPPHQIDNCIDPAKLEVQFQNKPAVANFLASTIQGFLVRHGFAVGRAEATQQPDRPSPAKRRRLLSPKQKVQANLPVVCADSNEEDDELPWTDPATGKRFIVNKRTGNSLIPGEHDRSSNMEAHRRTVRRQDEDAPREDVPRWIRDALEKNQVYALTESRIPAVPLSSQLGVNAQGHSCDRHSHPKQLTQFLDRAVENNKVMGFTREDLHRVRVVNQVDRKFIVCLMDDGKSLVVIDQHAADERVRVERFLKEICLGFLRFESGETGVSTRILEPALPVLLTRHEAQRLRDSTDLCEVFACWGVEFERLEVLDTGGEGGYVQVRVSGVPKTLADKLLVGDELRELVKGFIGTLDTDGAASLLLSSRKQAQEQTSREDPFSWLKALRWCPRELVDLINSKACRGAIMFNDALTIQQCERLVAELATTAFPFQCAHGRPSLAPLVSLGECNVGSGSSSRALVDWSRL